MHGRQRAYVQRLAPGTWEGEGWMGTLFELLCCFREVRRLSTENEAVGEDVDVEGWGEGVSQTPGKAEIWMNEGSPEQLLAALRFKVMDFKGSLSAPSCVFSRGSSSEQLMYIKGGGLDLFSFGNFWKCSNLNVLRMSACPENERATSNNSVYQFAYIFLPSLPPYRPPLTSFLPSKSICISWLWNNHTWG